VVEAFGSIVCARSVTASSPATGPRRSSAEAVPVETNAAANGAADGGGHPGADNFPSATVLVRGPAMARLLADGVTPSHERATLLNMGII
jgi:hypothetical protein